MSVIELTKENTTFRDTLTSVTKDGKRKWIYAQKPKGRLTSARSIVATILLVFLFGAPFLKVNGQQFMLFNILERKFVLFGIPFWPQDFYLIVVGVLILLVFIALFTAVFGRIWCGWLCPQTIFMEHVFRRIEFMIEGTHTQQRALDKAPMNANKFFKKALKHGIFYSISFAISNTFLAYIIGSGELLKIVTAPPTEHLEGFISIVLFSGVFYAVFARFREQACVVVCPYGRYMSSLVDNDTIAVTYDFKRGEPRGKFTRQERQMQQQLVQIDIPVIEKAQPKGDCIDCNQCVSVCPTGIDIRNGIQLECVNCTACIDACDIVMDKINKPRGLIRYTSYNAVENGWRWKITPRIIGYTTVLVLLMSTFGYLFASRSGTEVLILRQAGTLFQPMGDGRVANFYNIELINKTYEDINLELKVISPQNGTITPLGQISPLLKQTEKSTRFFMALPQSELAGTQTKVKFGIYSEGKLLKEVESTFLGPENVAK
jgi:cytochrome c oxidase accessory protein FixG